LRPCPAAVPSVSRRVTVDVAATGRRGQRPSPANLDTSGVRCYRRPGMRAGPGVPGPRGALAASDWLPCRPRWPTCHAQSEVQQFSVGPPERGWRNGRRRGRRRGRLVGSPRRRGCHDVGHRFLALDLDPGPEHRAGTATTRGSATATGAATRFVRQGSRAYAGDPNSRLTWAYRPSPNGREPPDSDWVQIRSARQ
jgi:hypothetical protein